MHSEDGFAVSTPTTTGPRTFFGPSLLRFRITGWEFASKARAFGNRRATHYKATETAKKAYRITVIALPAILISGFGTWFLLSGLDRSDAEPSPQLTLAVANDEPQAAPSALQPETVPQQAAAQPMSRLRILRQSFSRGGLGSKALVTFTLRNDNDFAVRDLKSCANSAARTAATPPNAAASSTTPSR
jgi:hypothetical protein